MFLLAEAADQKKIQMQHKTQLILSTVGSDFERQKFKDTCDPRTHDIYKKLFIQLTGINKTVI